MVGGPLLDHKMDHNRQDSGATIPAMSAVPHHVNHGRPHSRHPSPRRGKVVTADDEDEQELLKLYDMLRAKKAAKRSAEISTSLLREDDNNSAEKTATRTAGTPATFG